MQFANNDPGIDYEEAKRIVRANYIAKQPTTPAAGAAEKAERVICMTCFDDATVALSRKRAYCSRCKKWVDLDGHEIIEISEE